MARLKDTYDEAVHNKFYDAVSEMMIKDGGFREEHVDVFLDLIARSVHSVAAANSDPINGLQKCLTTVRTKLFARLVLYMTNQLDANATFIDLDRLN